MPRNDLLNKIPPQVAHVTKTLENAGFEAYLIGGCVRDLIMDRKPYDWDVTTNAKPEEIIDLFEKTVYENQFGTVAVMISRETIGEDVSYETVEVTPYRTESKYTDSRHPEEVKWTDKLETDLKRRDFTINALALNSKGQIVDLYEGLKDIKDKTIRAVGDPDERFGEDALRMLRAVRFACQLGFAVSHETGESIIKNGALIKKVSAERLRDELSKIMISDSPAMGIDMLHKFGLLSHIIPELEEGIGCDQSGEHVYDVWMHSLLAAQHAANKGWPLTTRLAALFHDVGKPRTRRLGTDRRKKQYTFYGHEVVGARITKKILERLKFSRDEIELVEMLVRNHMFFSDTEKITLSAVRRIISKVGRENIWTLMDVRECDRVGMKKKEAPYRLRKYFAMVEEALRDPISVAQLKIDGNYLKNELKISPGPRMGWILHALLEEVLDAPEKNTTEHLSELALSLNLLGDQELKALGERGKEKKEELEEEEIEKLHQKHGVKKQ
jgi:tRNA nucleotidyltransferase (CCA-adding enzyme)